MKALFIAVFFAVLAIGTFDADAHPSNHSHYHPGATPGSSGSYANPGWNQLPSDTYGGPRYPQGNGPYGGDQYRSLMVQ